MDSEDTDKKTSDTSVQAEEVKENVEMEEEEEIEGEGIEEVNLETEEVKENVIMEEEEEEEKMEEDPTEEGNVKTDEVKENVIMEVEKEEEMVKEDTVQAEELKENVVMEVEEKMETTEEDYVKTEELTENVTTEEKHETGEETAKADGIRSEAFNENVIMEEEEEMGDEANKDENIEEADNKFESAKEDRTGSISAGSQRVSTTPGDSLQTFRERLVSRTSSMQIKSLKTTSDTISTSNHQSIRERVASRRASLFQSKEAKLAEETSAATSNESSATSSKDKTASRNSIVHRSKTSSTGHHEGSESNHHMHTRRVRSSVGGTDGGKESGQIMGGDWRKVISKRRGATCSVEVIAKLRQSEMAIDRRKEEREFSTGSVFAGQVDAVGMHGECTYTMPHGVVFEGEMLDGRCEGPGTLAYPNNGRVDGTYSKGKLAPSTYTFPDGLVYELQNWTYCNPETPDRRFQQEIKFGLKPVCTSLKTQLQPTRPIPEGCYDTGDGFYNPKTRCVTSASTGNIIRIPTNSEAHWIAKNCRRAWDEPSGYRPSLNANFRLDDVNYAPLLMANRLRKLSQKPPSRTFSG